MKCALIVLCVLIGTSVAESKWCIQNVTTEIEVVKILSRTKMSRGTWFQSNQLKTETYQVVERVPHVKQKRVCCEGYVMDDRACIPTCANGCPKMSECVEPDTCKCSTGYHLMDGMCRLDCGNCENGRCTEAGICECNPGYDRVEELCKPICNHKCTDGFCAAPERCECNAGYVQNSTTSRCDPVCKQSCDGNAYCSAPEVCTCKYGFFGNATDSCQPWCKAECKNGQCVGPNKCACHQGFVKVDGLCIPDCKSGCMFGDCLDEGVCRCWPGFVYNNSTGSCQESLDIENTSILPTSSPAPVCLDGCEYGTCIANICHCREGFVKADSSCLLLCDNCQVGDCVEKGVCQRTTASPSTELSSYSTSESFTTVLIVDSGTSCDNGCWAGTCIDGVCQCPDGLILNDENDCIMPCEATCKNGICTQDKVCECRAGYFHKKGECVPQCDRECINSFCIAPNHCECLEGYIADFNSSSSHACLPTCDGVDGDEGCLNGTCVAINKCQCLEGFEHKLDSQFECVPMKESPTSMSNAERGHRRFWYVYLLLGLLILLVMTILGLYALRRMHHDSYNVDKVEKRRGTVRYKNVDQPYCVI